MVNNDKLILGTFSLLGLVVGFVIGYLLLDSAVSGLILGVGLSLAFAASVKATRDEK